MKVKITALVLGMLLIGNPSLPALAGDGPSQGKGQPIRVMTRNLYIGVDTDRILEPGDILLLAAEAYQVILQTNFPERAEALADEIAREKPDLIGIQEASLIRLQSPSNETFFPPDAEEVIFDYLDILLSALETRGLHYQVAAIVQDADVELPMYAFDESGDIIGVDDIRVTDRDVILARNDVEISNPISHTYANNAQFIVEGLPIEFTRGFVAVDAMVRERLFHFVSTHLEERGAVVDGQEIQALQASELVSERRWQAAARAYERAGLRTSGLRPPGHLGGRF